MNLTFNIFSTCTTVSANSSSIYFYSSAFFFRTSFGATAPPFIDYLKDILHRYPDGGQILKVIVCQLLYFVVVVYMFINIMYSYIIK